jgi:hypothetical protein
LLAQGETAPIEQTYMSQKTKGTRQVRQMMKVTPTDS